MLNTINMARVTRLYEFRASCEPYKISLSKGSFLVELWGASGGSNDVADSRLNEGGYGGYTSGVLTLNKPTTFYLYIGGEGQKSIKTSTIPSLSCNGGGSGGRGESSGYITGGSGGGATDMRVSTDLGSRIMVAGGGGGTGHGFLGGHGGGLVGGDGMVAKTSISSKGGTQTSGFALGTGQNGRHAPNGNSGGTGREGGGGGGGGYYGGYTSQAIGTYSNTGGGGGSSYISGHFGCTKRDDYYFLSTVMISGNSTMRSKEDFHLHKIGNVGNGFARILELSKSQPSCFIDQPRSLRLTVLIRVV